MGTGIYVRCKSSPEVVVGQFPNDVRLTDAHREQQC